MKKIDTHSQFASQHPHYAGDIQPPATGGSVNGTSFRAIPKAPGGQTETISVPGLKAAATTKKTIYDNVPIDSPQTDENGDNPSFCNVDAAGNDTPPPGPKMDNLTNFFKGVTKKQWFWAAAIGGGILILRKNK